MNGNTRKLQQGLSLIELVIAITISFFIAAALVVLFVNSKQNYRVNENMSRLQENVRFASEFLARDIRTTDFRTCVTASRLRDAIAGNDDEGLNDSDTVTVTWQSNACDTAKAIQTTEYSIQQGATGSPSLFRSVNGVSQELIEGIENLQILYGEDVNHDLVPDYFVDAASVDDMADAVSVRYTLLARTPETNVSTDGNRITREFTSTVTLRNRLP